jgi:hypothetical protein
MTRARFGPVHPAHVPGWFFTNANVWVEGPSKGTYREPGASAPAPSSVTVGAAPPSGATATFPNDGAPRSVWIRRFIRTTLIVIAVAH